MCTYTYDYCSDMPTYVGVVVGPGRVVVAFTAVLTLSRTFGFHGEVKPKDAPNETRLRTSGLKVSHLIALSCLSPALPTAILAIRYGVYYG